MKQLTFFNSNNLKFRLTLISGIILLSTGLTIDSLEAQTSPIIPDNTLPINSQVTPNGNQLIINQGTSAGNNLFHSFEAFSLPTGYEAFFNNSLAIQNIFSRVTGTSISNIDGIIRANGIANLFFLNPNGIIFGSNAQLDIGGSFFGSTANSILFEDNSEFSATNPNNSSLLSISMPIGLQFRDNSAQIQVQGAGHQLQLVDPLIFFSVQQPNNPNLGLQVQNGKTLALVGGLVNLEGGIITAPEGNIELGGVKSGLVRLNSSGIGWTLDYQQVDNFQNIALTQKALVDTSGNSGGSIQVQGSQIALLDGSVIWIENRGSQPSGNIAIHSSQSVELKGLNGDRSTIFPSTIFTQAIGQGKGGDILISTEQLNMDELSRVDALTLLGGARGGNLVLNARDSINMNSGSPLIDTSILSRTQFSGDAGNITVSTNKLTITNGGTLISPSNIGTGNAGDVTVKAVEIEIIGVNPGNLVSSQISTPTRDGNAGNVEINTARLILRDGGLVNSATLATGNAGSVRINASESVEISGTFPQSILASQISSSALIIDEALQQLFGIDPIPTGASGNVTVNTPQLTITNQGLISVRNDGTGDAGNLEINADSIVLDNQGGIAASTASGEGGNIFLNLGNNLRMNNSSFITATAGGGGNSGNITIDTPILILQNGATISALSILRQGGDIELEGLQTLEIRDNSEISVSTETGEAGSIGINQNQTPVKTVDITNGSRLAAQATQPQGEAGSISVNTTNLAVNQGSSISAANISGRTGGDINLLNLGRLEVNGAEISATTRDGKAGNLAINQGQTPVKIIELNAGSLTVEATGMGESGNLTVNALSLNLQNNAEISASTNFGQGGDITLEGLDTLEVNNSQISASTQAGRGGNLTIKTTNSVQLSGQGKLSVEATQGGRAGNLSLETGQMSISERANVTVSSPQGQAGNLTIKANSLSLNNGFITAETGQSEGEEGANITLRISDFITLENESLISATANGSADGGNIDIETPFLIVFPSSPNGSDIIAKAEQGSGGRIAINSQGIFGIEEGRATPGNQRNDLDASSESGSTGEILLNRELDPNRGLVELPETIVDPNSLIAQNACQRGTQSEFSVTGRGGLPPSLNEDLSSEATQVDLVQPAPFKKSEVRSQKLEVVSNSSGQTPVIPAQGWIFNEKGEIVLVAYDPTMTDSQRLRKQGNGCHQQS